MRLLHVEDDSSDLEIVARTLREQLPGDDLVSAPTLAAARAALSSATFDVLLLDLHLPDGEGFELLQELRESGDTIASVVLTGDGEEAAVRGALKAGADEFLVKNPGYYDQLSEAIRSAQRKAANKLIESERRFRELFERTPSIAVQGYDRERRVIYWNHASEELYGFSAEEALGRRLEDLIIPEAMRENVVSMIEAWLADRGRSVAAAEMTLQRKDGSPTQVFSSHVLLDGPGGEPELYCIDVDLNRQKRAVSELEASEARYRQVVENVSEVIFHVDAEGRLSFVNRAWEVLTGFSRDESRGDRFLQFVHPDDHKLCEVLFAKTSSGPQLFNHCEFRVCRRDGSVRWVEAQAGARDPEGGQREVYGTLIDITERLRARLLQQARSDVLDMIVADRRLEEVMGAIIAQVELMRPDLMAGIMLLDRDNWVFERAFSRSLPDFYTQVLIDLFAGEQVGSCGAAASSGAVVISRDLQLAPNWRAYRDLVARAGLRSCWSMPFKDEAGEVLGTFAIYTARVHAPEPQELALIAELAALASVAVQKKRAGERVLRHEAALEQSARSVLDLMCGPDFDQAVIRVLKNIGEVTEVDRVYVFQRSSRDPGADPIIDMTHEWCRDGIESQLGNPALMGFELVQSFPRWYQVMSEGRSVCGDIADFPLIERGFFKLQGIKSLLAVPVFVEDCLWGFVGFDAVRKKKRWSAPEESVLRIVATSIGAAVERHHSLERLRLWAAAFESTRDGVVITDLKPRVVAINRAYSEITGYSEDEVMGRNPGLLRSERHPAAFYREMWRSLNENGHWQGEVWNRRRNGEVYPQWLNLAEVRGPQGRPTHYVGVLTDISELKRSEAQLQKLAHYDPLTSLPNRTLALLRLERAINDARRHDHGVGVLFIDLDRFKNINDSFGHPVGDELLEQLARRLATRVRAEDTLARLGGDEFLLVLERIEDPSEAGVVAESLIGLLDTPFTLSGGQEVYVGSSVGISIFPRDSDTPTGLIQHADAALYKAKADGRKTFSYFTAELGVAAKKRIELETRLRRAVERKEFILHYQPKLAVADGRIIGCEALVRWVSPELGMVQPSDFIPLAEETGLIEPIGEWVMREACRQAARWRREGRPELTVAVNVSARQLWQTALPARVAGILRETGLDPARLELELTESVIMGQETLAAERFGQLKSLGVKLAIDDFGTGYSSLAYLKRFPIDVLKIDRSFIRDIPGDANDMEIAAAIIAMSRALRLTVVAEGVETPAQLAFLAETACYAYQGYLFSPPVPAEDFEHLLVADLARDP